MSSRSQVETCGGKDGNGYALRTVAAATTVAGRSHSLTEAKTSQPKGTCTVSKGPVNQKGTKA